MILVYGAYGYTGRLVAERAAELGLPVVLAGRDEARLRAVADPLGLEHRTFSLEVPSTIDACLEGAAVVLHCAGPFSRTSRPMVDACLRTGTHYLDVTGEVSVFEALAARADEAKAAHVMLMPGVGFDVVPSDCLAVHVARRLDDPTVLRIAILGLGGGLSHGTATTMVENLHRGGLIRDNGLLQPIRNGSITRRIDFGRGPRLAMAVAWGDLSTAWRSTRIPRIETYFAVSRSALWGARAVGTVPWLVKSGPVQRLLKQRIDARSPGPTAEERARGRTVLWAEVENGRGERAVSRLETPEGYTLTAAAALHIARRVETGVYENGFQTPAMVYGPDLVLELPGVRRHDVPC